MEKTPETTIATLDLGSSCLLTLTNKHLRGQITKYVEVGRGKNGNPIVRLQKDSLDVLLSGIAGYSLDFQNMKGGGLQIWSLEFCLLLLDVMLVLK